MLRTAFTLYSYAAPLGLVGALFFRHKPWFFHVFVYFFLLPYCLGYALLTGIQFMTDSSVLTNMGWDGVMLMFSVPLVKVTSVIHFLQGDIQSVLAILWIFDRVGITGARHWGWKIYWAFAVLCMIWEPLGKLGMIGVYTAWLVMHGLPKKK